MESIHFEQYARALINVGEVSGNPFSTSVGHKLDRPIEDHPWTQDGRLGAEKVEPDSNNDGQMDTFKFYHKGELIRQEQDENGDGKINVWLYLNERRQELDRNRDGRVDAWLWLDEHGKIIKKT